MRILYIHPDTSELRESQITIPIGMVSLSYLISCLDVEYKGINLPIEKKLNGNFDIEKYIKDYNPNVVLIDLNWMIYSYKSIEIAKLVKKINSKSIVILGGITATIYAEEIMNDYICIDFITRGFSQVCTIELIKSLIDDKKVDNISNLSYRKDNEVIHNPIKEINLDDYYNYDDYDFLEHYEYMLEEQSSHMEKNKTKQLAWIPTGIGCSFNCSYCGGNNLMFKKEFCINKTVPYESNKIITCMDNLYKKYNIDTFGITHDFGIFPPKYYEEVLDQISRLSFKPSIYNYLFQLSSLEYFERYLSVINQKESIIGLPVVCGNEKYRKLNGKLFSNKELFDFLEFITKYSINLELYFIVNPYYGACSFDETLELIDIILKEYKHKMNIKISCGFEIIQPYSKKQTEGRTVLNSFKDFYYRYSPEFLSDIKREKNIEFLTGDKEYDNKLYYNLKRAKELIDKYE